MVVGVCVYIYVFIHTYTHIYIHTYAPRPPLGEEWRGARRWAAARRPSGPRRQVMILVMMTSVNNINNDNS